MDTTTVEGYHKYCEDFHKNRLTVASSAWHKLLNVQRPSGAIITEAGLTSAEIRIAAEALQYYLRHTG